MRLSGITPESFVDGPGLRYVIFAQGCPHHCPHCHNPDSWDTDAGKEISVKEIIRLLKQQKKKIRGVSFSGGEPFLQAKDFAEIAHTAHRMGLDVVTYTGFTYEELTADGSDNTKALLYATDILIDGRYIHKLRSMELQFRGSSNQRMIDVAETLGKGEVVLYCAGNI